MVYVEPYQHPTRLRATNRMLALSDIATRYHRPFDEVRLAAIRDELGQSMMIGVELHVTEAGAEAWARSLPPKPAPTSSQTENEAEAQAQCDVPANQPEGD